MNDVEAMNALQDELDAVIGRMRSIQREIAATGQPASVLEIDTLSALGRRYAEIVGAMRSTRTECGESRV